MLIDNWWVQGRSGSDRELFDTAALVGHLVPAGSVYAFLAEHRGQVCADGLFADLFPSGRGRPSVPAEVIASVLVLQTLQDLSDAEAMEALCCDLRWKVACGLPIDHGGFHPTTLTVWRNRLRASDRPERIFEAVRAVVAATGGLTGKTRRALVSALVEDARTVVAALADVELDERAGQAVALLALVAGQDVEPAEGCDGTDGRWRIARRVAEDRVISTVDPDARHAHKTRHRGADGFKAHLVAEPDTGLITGC